MIEGIFHSRGGVDDQELNDEDGCLDMGPEDPVEKRSLLESKVEDVIKNGISTKSAQTLLNMLIEFDETVKMRLSSPVPAGVEPMIINLNPGPIPIKEKQRRYPPEE